ncbi:protein TolR [Magnetospira sp. QH-2]|uniref:protein TolR n=1 Tax=Magnetospira sp. (strain QH-2) TaxID=1288970 RepID=UPI0003E80D88|nr:protein TolR [Magnetospira sp. QH-2]CCQ73315.1 Membrane spanning protein TolR/ExbD [Magnetospira sp. QH-2]
MAVRLSDRTNRLGRTARHRMVSDINVTPMVDVMLVLLVVFMVTAPLLTVGVKVDLPEAQAKVIEGDDEPLTLTVKADGSVFLQEAPIDLANLAPRLIAITGANPDARIFVRGDKTIPYGRVMEVMGAINEAGFRRAALVTDLPRKKQRANNAKTGGGAG